VLEWTVLNKTSLHLFIKTQEGNLRDIHTDIPIGSKHYTKIPNSAAHFTRLQKKQNKWWFKVKNILSFSYKQSVALKKILE